jgi:7-keto-8-aminopelargonate synthetase-like enzyme
MQLVLLAQPEKDTEAKGVMGELIITGTLGKALGVVGGYTNAKKEITEMLRQKQDHIFSLQIL